MKRKGIVVAFLAVMLLIIGMIGVVRWNRQEVSISINQDEIHHIIANIGTGSQRLNYDEHQEILNKIVVMVNGEYVYKRTWNNYGTSGGGPYFLRFINKSGEVEYELRYINGYLAVSANKKGLFYLYEKKGEQLSFIEFEEYLSVYGEFDR